MAGIEDFTAAIATAFDRLNDAIAGMESARSAAGESATSLQAVSATRAPRRFVYRGTGEALA